ncbi:MAG: hypothetical protein IJK06_09470 [Clostridia bacterium]|nr:hypothetical protein [Clostridia bacterium]
MERQFVDIHSHIIFGADDGAETLDEAIELLKRDWNEGAAAVFATPHYAPENGFAPEAFYVREKFEMLKETAARDIPGLRLFLGSECYGAWDVARRIRRNEAFRMNGTDYVMVDFLEYGSTEETPEMIRANLAEMIRQGLKPILAHPESSRTLAENRDLVMQLTEMGVLLQVNGFNLDLNLSVRTKEMAQWLAKERLVSFIGSDMHGRLPKRTPRMKEGIAWLYRNTDKEYADAVCFGNAVRMLIAPQVQGT